MIYGNSFSVFRFPRDVPALFSLRNIGRFAGVILTPPGGKAALLDVFNVKTLTFAQNPDFRLSIVLNTIL